MVTAGDRYARTRPVEQTTFPITTPSRVMILALATPDTFVLGQNFETPDL